MGWAAAEAGQAGPVLLAGHQHHVVAGQFGRSWIEGPADDPDRLAAVRGRSQPVGAWGELAPQHQQAAARRGRRNEGMGVAMQQPRADAAGMQGQLQFPCEVVIAPAHQALGGGGGGDQQVEMPHRWAWIRHLFSLPGR